MAYNPVDVELLRDRVDILDTVRRYVDLKKSGSNWVGLCPFHREKSPSFNVNPSRNMWKCFGCHEGGDVFKFLMMIRNLTFPEVLEELAEENGITLKVTGDVSGAVKRRSGIYTLLEAVQEFFSRSFAAPREGKPGLILRTGTSMRTCFESASATPPAEMPFFPT